MKNTAAISMLIKFWLLTITITRMTRCDTSETGYFNPETHHPPKLYIGSYMNQLYEDGISIFEMNEEGVFQKQGGLQTSNPAYLVADKSGRFIYAGNELHGNTVGEIGNVTAYSVGEEEMSTINCLDAQGSSPAHVTLDPTDRFVLSANYDTGKVVVMALDEQGRLNRTTHVTEAPAGEPHSAKAHMVSFHPMRKNVVGVSYLGLDRIYFYKFHYENGTLSPLDIDGGSTGGDRHLTAQLDNGVGPRHFVFSNDSRFLYVVGELSSTVTVFESLQDPNTAYASFKLVQSLSTLPADYKTKSHGSEIALHRNGKFLYASNRGHDSIAVFAVNEISGLVSPLGYYSTGGRTPRHFTLSPDGRQLIVGNQNSDSVVIFSVNLHDGSLKNLYRISEYISTPSFILYMASKERN